jgi:hypothetical protein
MLTYFRCVGGRIEQHQELPPELLREPEGALHWIDLEDPTVKRLTVFAAILACLTVITGVYGMNFEHMPELHGRYGYLWAIFLMLAVPAGIVLWFRKQGWL